MGGQSPKAFMAEAMRRARVASSEDLDFELSAVLLPDSDTADSDSTEERMPRVARDDSTALRAISPEVAFCCSIAAAMLVWIDSMRSTTSTASGGCSDARASRRAR